MNNQKGLDDIVGDMKQFKEEVPIAELQASGYKLVQGHKPLAVNMYGDYAICYTMQDNGRYRFLSVVKR